MELWDRKYNTPTVMYAPYTVEVSRPSGWIPTDGTTPYNAEPPDPTSSYFDLPYKKIGPGTTIVKDLWYLGPVFTNKPPRTVVVKVRNTTGGSPTDPISTDRPVIRDGSGGGYEAGTMILEIAGKRIVTKYRIIESIRRFGPIPEPPINDGEKKLINVKKSMLKKRK